MKNRLRIALFILAFVIFTSATSIVLFYTDLLWFTDLGFSSVYLKLIGAKTVVGFVFGGLMWLALLLNIYIARRLAPKVFYLSPRLDFQAIMQQLRPVVERFFHPLAIGASLLIAFSSGITASGSYMTWMQFFSHAGSKVKDPLFGKSLDFHFFVLPGYAHAQQFIALTILLSGAFAVATHFLHGGIVPGMRRDTVSPAVKAHVSVLGSLLLLDLAWYWYLARYQLLYSSRGVVFGAAYTDVKATLPSLAVLAVLAVISAAIMLFNLRHKGWTVPAVALTVLAAGWLLVGNLYPAAIQAYRVTPNEIVKESPYIKLGLDNTLAAYNLDKITARQFPATEAINTSTLNANRPTVDNIRLWDWRPLRRTYSQIQEIRLYYTFNDVDFDRYDINGASRQIALGARELDISRLPSNAQTWINQHLVFTHGYGAVASPVNEVTREGLPVLYVKDIPPVSTTDLKLDKPQIYFGEKTSDYAVVRTKTAEFDYPSGQKNRYTRFKAATGIRLSSFWRKAALAYRFATAKLLLSDAIDNDSRVLFDRDITTRLNKVAPFLSYDPDPYLVLSEGRMVWLIDAFTLSDRYPYSKPFNGRDNYIRNSVKVTVDAYDGTTKFYLFDPSDPVAATYKKVFPKLFTETSAMPKDIMRHLRYPESLFSVQTEIYRTFHMTDPQVFYNKEDQWDIPTEIADQGAEPVAPYYVIMKLPGEKKEEFVLIQPFSPANKKNMIAWMTARSDGPDYGKLLVFDFPKNRLVFGPQQMEARIDQEPEISRQLSLWNQRGSRVIRGNLLVIPINDTLLYVEPIYLEAEETQLPELKRVIVGFAGRVAMGVSFDDAVKNLFVGDAAPTPSGDDDKLDTVKSLASEAASQYEAATAALKAGDFTEYGKQIGALGETLKQLETLSGK